MDMSGRVSWARVVGQRSRFLVLPLALCLLLGMQGVSRARPASDEQMAECKEVRDEMVMWIGNLRIHRPTGQDSASRRKAREIDRLIEKMENSPLLKSYNKWEREDKKANEYGRLKGACEGKTATQKWDLVASGKVGGRNMTEPVLTKEEIENWKHLPPDERWARAERKLNEKENAAKAERDRARADLGRSSGHVGTPLDRARRILDSVEQWHRRFFPRTKGAPPKYWKKRIHGLKHVLDAGPDGKGEAADLGATKAALVEMLAATRHEKVPDAMRDPMRTLIMNTYTGLNAKMTKKDIDRVLDKLKKTLNAITFGTAKKASK